MCEGSCKRKVPLNKAGNFLQGWLSRIKFLLLCWHRSSNVTYYVKSGNKSSEDECTSFLGQRYDPQGTRGGGGDKSGSDQF